MSLDNSYLTPGPLGEGDGCHSTEILELDTAVGEGAGGGAGVVASVLMGVGALSVQPPPDAIE